MCTLSFISLSLVWCASPCSAQESPGRWIEFEFTPSTTNIHVKTDSVLRRISDSIRTVNDKLAMMDRLQGDGLQDFLAVWINDSTLSLWISMDSLTSIMNRAMGRRDSTVFGAYDVSVHDWAFPGYIDEPPYPDWYSRDWKRLKKTGVYVNPASPLQIVWHMDGDSVATFELKLPRARLLQFLGIDTTSTASIGPRLIRLIYPDSGSNWSTFQVVNLNDSTRNFILAADAGLTFKPTWTSATKDTMIVTFAVDYDVLWYRIRDSVLANAGGGGGGATTFTGLTDTPASYAGQGGKIVSVKPDESGLEFTAPPAGGGGSSMVLIDTLGTWIDSVTYYTVEMMPPVYRMRQVRTGIYDSLSWYRTGWVEYIFPTDFTMSTRTGKGHYCYYLEIVSDSANGVIMTGDGEYDGYGYDSDYGVNVSATHGITRSEGVFSNNYGTVSSYGYSTVQAQRRINVVGSMDSIAAWYSRENYDPGTMTPRLYRHLLMVSGSNTTANIFLGHMRIRIYFHQRQGYASTWYIKPISWRLYRQWK